MEKILYKLSKEIFTNSNNELLSKEREVYLTRPLDQIEKENIFDYDLILKEKDKIIGRYESNTVQFSKENNSLFIIYSLHSMKPNSHVPRELISSFSNFQNYLSNKTGLEINHFAPITLCSSIYNRNKKKKGLIDLFKSLGYEQEDQLNFLTKSYSPKK